MIQVQALFDGGDPYFRLELAPCRTKERLNTQVLLDLLEEQIDFLAQFLKRSNSLSRKRYVIVQRFISYKIDIRYSLSQFFHDDQMMFQTGDELPCEHSASVVQDVTQVGFQ
jgi:hypothetical protein